MGEPFDAFRRFGSFGSHRSMMPSLFGGIDPFEDPFFNRPFEELNADGEEDKEKDEGTTTEHAGSGKEPSIEHPDDGANDGKIQNANHRNYYDRVEGTKSQARSFSVQTCKVTYGGVDGAYYTSTKSRRTGSDGVVIEERKEADRTTGQATHRISRGIHDKGHSVTRNLNSDGKVDTTQTLHNLIEDELPDFDEAWKGISQGHLPGWSDGFGMHADAGSRASEQMGKAVWDSWRLPFREQTLNTRGQGAVIEARTNSGGRTKKVVRINIE
ncbi:hypothetical protein REPUB_Repub12eG0195100 [Reevesia pubescens]